MHEVYKFKLHHQVPSVCVTPTALKSQHTPRPPVLPLDCRPHNARSAHVRSQEMLSMQDPLPLFKLQHRPSWISCLLITSFAGVWYFIQRQCVTLFCVVTTRVCELRLWNEICRRTQLSRVTPSSCFSCWLVCDAALVWLFIIGRRFFDCNTWGLGFRLFPTKAIRIESSQCLCIRIHRRQSIVIR